MWRALKLLVLVFLVGMTSWTFCFAETAEDVDDGPRPVPKIYNLGDKPPQVAPRPPVVRERIVVQCPPGSSWSSSMKRCVNDAGEDIAPPSLPPSPARPSATAAVSFTQDFESGELGGWFATGNAFKFQPTYGDNPTARHRGQPSNHQGDFWIGTYENRPTHRHRAGHTQGDGPRGTLTSAPFVINCNTISFLVGGGCDLNTERVELLIDGRVVDRATGKCTETMARDSFPVAQYVGRTAQIRLIDESSGGWGHINFDDIRFE